jgi:hypothetical protein
MKLPFLALVVAGLVLSGCGRLGESRLNPMNWFGSSREEAPDLGPTELAVDNRPLVAQITDLTIERTSSGAIVRATAMTPTPGWWDPALVAENFGRATDGVLTLRFVAAPPREAVTAPSNSARQLIAVYPVSEALLETLSAIVVTGQENSRRTRR